jgi:putative membrane protein
MKRILTATALTFALPALSMAQSATTPTAAQTLSAQDKLFIKKAAYAGLSEVSDGQLAKSKGDATVQKVATQMVTDHPKANDQLASLSQSLGDPAPTATDTKHLKIHSKLQGLSGSAFDSNYLKTQLQGHEMTITAFQTEISSGSNPQLKQFASQTLPILQMHLSMIKSAMAPANG